MFQFPSLTTLCAWTNSFHHLPLLPLYYLVLFQVSCVPKKLALNQHFKKYESDLLSPELFQMELKPWKNWYLTMPSDLRPVSPAMAIKECDSAIFPNISVLLQIACTLPVTFCECERSASALRWLNNYMSASMGKSSLSNLALLHIHYDTPIDLDKVVNCYPRLHLRRLELESLRC